MSARPGLREGEAEDAFGVLVSRCASMIQQQALRLRRVSIDAEDLAQEGFVGLLSAVRTFREGSGASFCTLRRCLIFAIVCCPPSAGLVPASWPSSLYEDLEKEQEVPEG